MSRRAREPDPQGGELAHDLVEPARELAVAHRLGPRLLADERDRPARLEDRAVHLVERREALLVRRRLELGERDQLGLQALQADLPVLDEDVRLALDQAVQPLVAVEEADHERVRPEQGRRAEQPAGDRVVVTDDGVLHRVREGEQHDQVEGIELRQLPLAREAEADHQEGVDDDGPQYLLGDRRPEVKHVAPQLRIHVRLLPAAECSARPGRAAIAPRARPRRAARLAPWTAPCSSPAPTPASGSPPPSSSGAAASARSGACAPRRRRRRLPRPAWRSSWSSRAPSRPASGTRPSGTWRAGPARATRGPTVARSPACASRSRSWATRRASRR